LTGIDIVSKNLKDGMLIKAQVSFQSKKIEIIGKLDKLLKENEEAILIYFGPEEVNEIIKESKKYHVITYKNIQDVFDFFKTDDDKYWTYIIGYWLKTQKK
nr:hypothetical protein [Candidatus Sigynarchaeota archaeon]